MLRKFFSSLFAGGTHEEAPPAPIRPLSDRDELDQALLAPIAVLYKYSPICSVSAWIGREVGRFASDHPDTPVYAIDVIRQRDLSNWIADEFGVRHESPQAFVVRNGRPTWNASHSGITADALHQQVQQAD
ncbi:MAG: bacillithiol system redox-active protein YtxJ [Gemmatimonadetes bacterium]|nr:bacillithiol system redox-active protein YtxJ [Gemmatimonadota bacterium]